MNNCKVTQYKKNVNNDNLVYFNTLVLKIKKQITGDAFMTIGAKAGTKVTASTGIKESSSGPIITEYTFPATGNKGLYLVNEVGNTISITSIYDIVVLQFASFKGDEVEVIGAQSMNKGSMAFVNNNGVADFLSIELDKSDLVYVDAKCTSNLDLNNSKQTLVNGRSLDAMTPSQCNQFIELESIAIRGDIGELVIHNNKIYNIGYPDATGSIEDFVAKQRLPVGEGGAGKTTGVIQFLWAVNATNVTYNGGSLAEYCAAQSITNLYVSWDASTITLSGTVPAGYVAPKTAIECMNVAIENASA